MTTISYRNGVMASDGQVSNGDRIDQLNKKKIRKINNCLIGGAGRLSSVLQFFEWFQNWSDAQLIQGEAPHVQVFVPEGINDEDFTGLVVFSDKVVFCYEGGKTSYELDGREYCAIGSGSDYALAAMDAGATAEEAVSVAIRRDVYTGGEIFSESLDPEPEEITRESAEEMTKEELINLLFGKNESEEVIKEIIYKNESVILNSDGEIKFIVTEKDDTLDILGTITFKEDNQRHSSQFKNIVKKLSRVQLDNIVSSLHSDLFKDASEVVTSFDNKAEILEYVLDTLADLYIAELTENE